MRVNLKCPYSEKDEAKALGARWDNGNRVWYVIDPPDMHVFSKWISDVLKFVESNDRAEIKKQKRRDHQKMVFTTGRPHQSCSCTSPPWEDCPHTELNPAFNE
jgi:hypothetical protein